MTAANISILSILGILIFLMISDETFAHYVYLRVNLVLINIKRAYLMFMLHPENKLTKWWFNYKLMKTIEKMKND